MNWEEYIKEVLSEEKYLDDIHLAIDGNDIEIPDLIKASVYLLEKILANQGRCNVFVFPDGVVTPYIFMLSKLIYNIGIGKISSDYDVEKFQSGQKLKFGSCITEFVKLDYEPSFNEEAIFLKFSNCTCICPKQFAPYFQTVSTKRRLSKYSVFKKEKERIESEEKDHNQIINSLYDMKTHMMESLIYISSLSKSIEFTKEIKIDNKDISDYFFISQTDYSGTLQTVKGLYSGTPALIFSSNIAYANAAIRNGASVQSFIINLIDNDINSQLPELDELIDTKVPVLCVTDTSHSFDLDELHRRGFNFWRWDEHTITDQMCSGSDEISKKAAHCKHQEITYNEICDKRVSDAFNALYGYRHSIENESAIINTVYNRLFELSCSFLRRITKLDSSERMAYMVSVCECENILEKEQPFLDSTLYDDFRKSIELIKSIIDSDTNEKIISIEKTILSKKIEKVCLICSNNDDVIRVKDEWKQRLSSHGYVCSLLVMTIKEFLKNPPDNCFDVFLSGWFGSRTVRLVLYGYESSKIHVFLYECENRWKRAHLRSWERTLNNTENNEIVKKSFNRKQDDREIVLSNSESLDKITRNDEEIVEEQDDLDLVIQENKYRQYVSRGDKNGGVEVEACPVSFAGGEFALFTRGHKSLTVTKIIHQSSNKIEEKETEELQVGDFIVVREASKDIIREVADKVLEASGQKDIRDRVLVWKEALRIETAFSSINDIYKKLQECGCTRGLMTVKNWINSDDIIIPQSKEDLLHIARATNDEVLLNKLDEVFDDGTFIKRAHIKAGNILSTRLSESIASVLMKDKLFDPYNVWDPIELNIEEIGLVRVYKIIDVSTKWIVVNSFDTNHLMNEEKEI